MFTNLRPAPYAVSDHAPAGMLLRATAPRVAGALPHRLRHPGVRPTGTFLGGTMRQDIIDLYDEYTHERLDRRVFMDQLAKLAGGTTAAAALVPILKANYANAAMVPADDARLTIEEVSFAGAGGDVQGYLVRPADASGPLPGVVVIHENRGLNPHIEDVARRIALEGFVTLAPDFLSPAGGTPDDEDQAREMIGALDAEQTLDNALAAVDFLATNEATNGNVGVVGFCWGGGMVNQVAVSAPNNLGAAVAYYGRQPAAEDVASIQAPIVLHYAGLDERINAGIPAYEEALKANEIDHTIYMYEGVNHAFNNDTSEARYDQTAAELAWQRTIDFFKQHLAG
jgi:carboxymethylenebutenolidase